MVLGATPAEAESLAALVEIEFEPLPPVVSIAAALQKGRPFVHDEWGDNILVDIKLEAGDLAAAKAAAGSRDRTQFPHEPDASAAVGRLPRVRFRNYKSRARRTRRLRRQPASGSAEIGLSRILGISQRRLRVVSPDVGASFGLKTYVESETVCVAWAAIRLPSVPSAKRFKTVAKFLVCDANCRDYQCKVVGHVDLKKPVVCWLWNAT